MKKSKKAMSAVVVASQLGLVCMELGWCRFIPLTKGELVCTIMDCHYFFMERADREEGASCYTKLKDLEVQEEALLLPQVQLYSSEDPNFTRYTYAVVDRNHRTLDKEGFLSL